MFLYSDFIKKHLVRNYVAPVRNFFSKLCLKNRKYLLETWSHVNVMLNNKVCWNFF